MMEPAFEGVGTNRFLDSIGGLETLRLLSDEFHRRVEGDEVLGPLFPKDLTHLRGWFAMFLGERFGERADYTARRGKRSLVCRHAHLAISTEEADRWIGHMLNSIDEVGICDPARASISEFFVETAQTLTDPFLPLYDLDLVELRSQIIENRNLLQTSPAGHSLLKAAVCRWDLPRFALLLELGADAKAREPLGHGLLYRAANAQGAGSEIDGRGIVELLVRFGAEVNLSSGPGRSTPLHMAARRGHILLAEILLESGANLEAKDSKGETPLRRAVNCRQEEFVRFLLFKGAHPLNPDKKDRTPLDAAKSEVVRNALQFAARDRPYPEP